MGRCTRMTRPTRILRLAKMNRLHSMNRETRLRGAIILGILARIYRMHILNSMCGTARPTRMRRMKKNRKGGTITMEISAWRNSLARF